MSIKVLADKVLAFDRGEHDRNGVLIQERTKIGFNTLPAWVEKTDLYKAAVADGSLKSFNSSADSEAVLKEQEKLAALRDEIKALEEKRDMLASFDSSLSLTKDDEMTKALGLDTPPADETGKTEKSKTK